MICPLMFSVNVVRDGARVKIRCRSSKAFRVKLLCPSVRWLQVNPKINIKLKPRKYNLSPFSQTVPTRAAN
jgi:hypothetical protein